MIDAVGGAGGFRPPPPSSSPLTEDQKSTVSDILSQYDASSLSEEDAQSIFQALKDAGIPPSEELKSMIEDAGFDLSQFAPPPPPEGGRGPGGPGGMVELSEEDAATLDSIFDSYDMANLTEEDKESINQALLDAGIKLDLVA
ncbi:hypothetical protein [Emcibacter nanhaiensis]|uniref:Uncharacterized protein n=1 Tax=Emcibacter nanhaiensis TaxID=1505037 RepID=A0A501PHP0_9PROT|nr:hypothetical protein [Emcibacter nanhaiensis]TPD59454.1 hypothetical protein FIV46_11730 [Emcibacter nanhaiensis]